MIRNTTFILSLNRYDYNVRFRRVYNPHAKVWENIRLPVLSKKWKATGWWLGNLDSNAISNAE